MGGRDSALGTPTSDDFFEMIHEEDREILRDTIDASLAAGMAYELTVRQLLADGECRDLLLRGQSIFDVDGYTSEIYGVLIPQSK